MTHLNLIKSAGLSALLASAVALPAQAAFFHVGSGSIDGSLCVGFDCVSAEAFGSDTIRLKENNLRIHFDDTSVGSFPAVDWRLRANDTASGGASYFAIENASAGRTPFRVDDGARNNALYVDDQGDVGIGTSTPSTDLHITIGDTPTVRLEQNTSSGFAAQTWDVAGNETSFFIRNVTGGSTLPFRIMTGSTPSSSLVIANDGDVGISSGTSPSAQLHVTNADASDDGLRVTNTGTNANLMRLEATNAAPTGIGFVMDPSGGANFWQFTATANEDIFRINRSGGNGTEFELNQNGNLTITGSLTQGSDKNAKTAIEPIDSGDILAKVVALPVSRWTYKAEADTGTRHIGPMAQDFYALFGTGADERGISTLDSSGVALAAIQALAAENDELRTLLQDQAARHEARIRLLEEKAAN